LYTVLEQQAAAVGANLMGSDHTYVIPPAAAAGATPACDQRGDGSARSCAAHSPAGPDERQPAGQKRCAHVGRPYVGGVHTPIGVGRRGSLHTR